MGKERPPGEAVQRIFIVTMAGTILWVAASFVFVILR
jgi:hypothetical protein